MLHLVHHSDPLLSTSCKPILTVDEKVQELALEMIRFLPSTGGIGLAASQVGEGIRLFVVDIWWPHTENSDSALVFINPTVTFLTTETARREEGCLSFPDVRDSISRLTDVQVDAQDISGEAFTMKASGLLSVVIQHENDHLNGITFLERMSAMGKKLARKKLAKAK